MVAWRRREAFRFGKAARIQRRARIEACFGMDTAIVTVLADNPVGRLVQDLIYQGGVDQTNVRWIEYDGVGAWRATA